MCAPVRQLRTVNVLFCIWLGRVFLFRMKLTRPGSCRRASSRRAQRRPSASSERLIKCWLNICCTYSICADSCDSANSFMGAQNLEHRPNTTNHIVRSISRCMQSSKTENNTCLLPSEALPDRLFRKRPWMSQTCTPNTSRVHNLIVTYIACVAYSSVHSIHSVIPLLSH